jgi:hypothetical protein
VVWIVRSSARVLCIELRSICRNRDGFVGLKFERFACSQRMLEGSRDGVEGRRVSFLSNAMINSSGLQTAVQSIPVIRRTVSPS